MSSETHELEFAQSLEDTDYGLIICGKTGMLKGLWIPKGADDDEVPESIIRMCVDIFGIDESEFEDDGFPDPQSGTLH